ncbi:unnamed protein product [Calypogeia fissa]
MTLLEEEMSLMEETSSEHNRDGVDGVDGVDGSEEASSRLENMSSSASPRSDSSAPMASESRSPISFSSPLLASSADSSHHPSPRRSSSVGTTTRNRVALPIPGPRDALGRSPLLYPHSQPQSSSDHTPLGPRTSPQDEATSRGGGGGGGSHHSRSASVPSSGFPPFQPPQSQSTERVGRSPGHSRWHSITRARSSAESEFFKPYIDVKADQHQSASSPVQSYGDKSKIVRLNISRSIDSSQMRDFSSGPPGPPSGAGSPRQPPTTPENGFGGGGSQRGSGRRDDEPNTRVVYINNPERSNERKGIAGNKVRTSKYTLLSFLPRNLFEQFHRYAYIYFLIIVILNQIPALAVFGRTASLFPLIFVLVVTAIKDAYEDYGRHHSDTVENNRTSLVLQDGHYKPKKWKHMRVGEVVKLLANETVPCDLVLLGTSDPSGVAYVETLNLDGESNLKSRYATQETAAKHPELGPITGTLICEVPNRNIYDFTAYMDLGGTHLPLGPKNIVLRGCEIKNTAWVVGVVVYAGQETKAMLNSSGTQSKRSRLEQEMNRETLWLGLFLFILCLSGGIGMGLWVNRHQDDLNEIPYYRKKYIDKNKNYMYYGIVGEGVIGFLSDVIMFQIMIPISLYISLELVRLGQAYFMTNDAELYHEESNTRFQCRALNINEDLGQIKYVFSDKTGTLTENKMEFFSASVNGVDYSDAEVAVDPASGKVEGPPDIVNAVQETLSKQSWKPKAGAKVDPNLIRAFQHPFNSEERRAVHEYLLVLAGCNTIVPTRVSISTTTGEIEMQAAGSEEGNGLMEYHGESPDEQALVAAAATYGYTLLERTSTHITIDILGDVQRFEVLGIHEFDSIRKRMSVIVRGPDGIVKLLMKGADSAVLNILESPERQDMSVQKRRAELSLATMSHLDGYAREGLRTLVIASRDMSAAELKAWDAQYSKASKAVGDRAGLLRDAAELVERDVILLGATGIEDKLQDGVPETIALLREANMQVWVLTGDKQETAISIAFSCLLITREMQQVIINETTLEGCKEALANAKSLYGVAKVTQKKKPRFLFRQKKTMDNISNGSANGARSPPAEVVDGDESTGLPGINPGQPLALVIDGNSLVHCLSEELEQELFELAIACKVVVCCRVAPLQKAGIVALVKRKAKEMTLAIGDGANDVSMIQMADVGIGISGQEGRQAVMASDFAMGQFRFLSRVLLVHGHWNYFRLSYMVLYNFYRNAVFVLMLFWFILYTLFSPQSAITDWNLVLYSVIYTSIPTIVVGILDKDLGHRTLLRYPTLYSSGQRRLGYNQPLFWATMSDTVWQSLVLFYVPYFTYKNSQVDIWGLGSLWIMAVVILVNMHLAMDIQRWTWIHHVAIWGSILATWLCVMIMDSIKIDDLMPHYWVFFHMVTEWKYWFDLLLILAMALLPRFCVKVFWERFYPSDIQVAREADIMGLGNTSLEQGGGFELSEVPHSPEPC